MSVEGFQNKGKIVSENTVKLKFKENIKYLLYDPLVYIYAEERDFFQLYDQHAK